MGRAPFGFSPDASTPAVASDARQGGDGSRTLLRSSLSSTFPILQSLSSLVPCDLVSQRGLSAIDRFPGSAMPFLLPPFGPDRGGETPVSPGGRSIWWAGLPQPGV